MQAFKKLFSSAGEFKEDVKTVAWNKRDFYKMKKGSNYDLNVAITGEAPYSSCVLSVNAVTGGERKLPIAARFSWKKYYSGSEEDLLITSNTIHLSPLDAGYYIKVYVTPIEEDNIYHEVSHVVFGPIVLDPQTKKMIQGIMRGGGSKFQLKRVCLAESEDCGTEASIMLSKKEMFVVSSSNLKVRIMVPLVEKFKIHSQRNQFMTLALEFPDSSKSAQISQFFNIPKTKNFRKLKLTMAHSNSKDVLILAINVFRNLITIRDSELFQLVKTYIKDAPAIPASIKQTDPEHDSEEDEIVPSQNEDVKDAIDLLLLNNGLKDEAFRLYKSNKELAQERDKLQTRLFDLESKASSSKSGMASFIEHELPRQSSMHENDATASLCDQNKLNLIRQKNSDIEENIRNIRGENDRIRKDIERISGIFKQVRYKEMMESKLNASTANRSVREVSNLEQALEDYAKEYNRVMGGLGLSPKDRNQSQFILAEGDSDRSLSIVDEMEEKALEINMKNERLKEELAQYREIVSELEVAKEQPKAERMSFLGNESFVRGNQVRPEMKLEYDVRIENLEARVLRTSNENKDLAEQVKTLAEQLQDEEENDSAALKYQKLKQQQNELIVILENKRKRIVDLEKKKIALSDQEIDLKATTTKKAESFGKQFEDALFKKEQLTKTNQLLFRELQDQKRLALDLEEEHKRTFIESTVSPLSQKSNIEKMKTSIAEVEERIALLRSAAPKKEKLTAEELGALEQAKKMNEKFINEIVRLNDMIAKNNKDRDMSFL